MGRPALLAARAVLAAAGVAGQGLPPLPSPPANYFNDYAGVVDAALPRGTPAVGTDGILAVLAKKRAYDPDLRFQSEWWRHYAPMFE